MKTPQCFYEHPLTRKLFCTSMLKIIYSRCIRLLVPQKPDHLVLNNFFLKVTAVYSKESV